MMPPRDVVASPAPHVADDHVGPQGVDPDALPPRVEDDVLDTEELSHGVAVDGGARRLDSMA